jgi:hypothetical protein
VKKLEIINENCGQNSILDITLLNFKMILKILFDVLPTSWNNKKSYVSPFNYCPIIESHVTQLYFTKLKKYQNYSQKRN